MTKRNQDFSKDILSLIRSSVSPAVLSEKLQDFHENDLAEVLRELSTAERSRLYRILESGMLADVFLYRSALKHLPGHRFPFWKEWLPLFLHPSLPDIVQFLLPPDILPRGQRQ